MKIIFRLNIVKNKFFIYYKAHPINFFSLVEITISNIISFYDLKEGKYTITFENEKIKNYNGCLTFKKKSYYKKHYPFSFLFSNYKKRYFLKFEGTFINYSEPIAFKIETGLFFCHGLFDMIFKDFNYREKPLYVKIKEV